MEICYYIHSFKVLLSNKHFTVFLWMSHLKTSCNSYLHCITSIFLSASTHISSACESICWINSHFGRVGTLQNIPLQLESVCVHVCVCVFLSLHEPVSSMILRPASNLPEEPLTSLILHHGWPCLPLCPPVSQSSPYGPFLPFLLLDLLSYQT